MVFSEFHVNVFRVGYGCAAPVSWLLSERAGDSPQSFVDPHVLGEGLHGAGCTETLTKGCHARAIVLTAPDDVFLYPVEDSPKVVADILNTVHTKGDIRADGLGSGIRPTELDSLLCKVEGIICTDLGSFPALDDFRHVLGLAKDCVRGIEHGINVQLVVTQTDTGNRAVGYHDPVGARHAEDPCPDLEAACSIVGVYQDGLDPLADVDLQLALMRETQEVALQSLARLFANLGFRALREHPAITAEGVHNFIGRDKAIAV